MWFVSEGNLAIRTASRMFSFPRSTLAVNLPGRVPNRSLWMVSDAVVTVAEETKFVEWLTGLVKWRFQSKNNDLLNTVPKVVMSDSRQNPLNDGRPEKSWYRLILRRNPNINQWESHAVSKRRGVIFVQDFWKWFHELESILWDQDILEIYQDTNNIFNGDETSFSMYPKSSKVITPKGLKKVHN